MRNWTADRTLQTLLALSTVLLAVVLWDTMRDKNVYVGDIAPDFEVRTDSGFTLARSNYGGKVLVLNFWATWCPPCVQEVPMLQAIHEQFKDAGVVVLGVSVDKNEAKYKEFLRRFGVGYQTSRDPQGKVGDIYGTYKYPETYVIDPNGKVVQKIIGAEWTTESLARFIKSLL